MTSLHSAHSELICNVTTIKKLCKRIFFQINELKQSFYTTNFAKCILPLRDSWLANNKKNSKNLIIRQLFRALGRSSRRANKPYHCA